MTRAEEAQRLVDEGRVDVFYVKPWETEVHVEGERPVYTVSFYRDGSYYCNCGWLDHHPNTYNLCVHALAAKLAVERKVADAEA